MGMNTQHTTVDNRPFTRSLVGLLMTESGTKRHAFIVNGKEYDGHVLSMERVGESGLVLDVKLYTTSQGFVTVRMITSD